MYFSPSDTIKYLKEVSEFLKSNPDSEVTLNKGVYHIKTEKSINAMEMLLNGSWGDNPEKIMFNPRYDYDIGFLLSGIHNCIINAEGVTFMVEGFMEPVSIRNSNNLTLKGLTIDHLRKPYSFGKITKISEKDGENNIEVTVKLDNNTPIREKTPINLRHIFYDTEKDKVIRAKIHKAKFVDEYEISVKMPYSPEIKQGNEFYTIHTYHSRPAILIENSENITLKDISIHSQPGMGIVGNRSENISLIGLKVIPSENHHFSTNTDATHFTSIKGKLLYDGCTFISQGDDSLNVHSYYHDIIEMLGNNTYRIKENTPGGTHAQTLDYPDEGDTLELTDILTLKVLGEYKAIKVIPDFENLTTLVTLNKPLPENTENLVLTDVTRLPKLEIRNCVAKKHFARGFLVKSRGVIIEDNEISEVPLAGIEIAAESNWYEGVSPCDVTIRRNKIYDCKCGILVKADCKNPEGQSVKNILIEDNEIYCPQSSNGIIIENSEKVIIRNNKILSKDDNIVIKNSSEVEVI